MTADPLTADPHPAIRLPAKEVLIDAHLGAAHDIAWGNWSKKQTTVPIWLKRATAFAEDLIQSDGGTPEHRFRVATRALSTCVGAQGQIDPTEWVDQVLRVGQELVGASVSPTQKRQLQWELGLALYDAVQIYQMRNQRELSLKHGERAIEYLEAARGNRSAPTDAYLLGRLYFRLGSIHALGEHNHRAAITWFDKAVPVLQQAATEVAPFELGRLGETFVSMGVSYWESGQRDNAVKLTQSGVELMEKAVAAGEYQKSALDIPYANLATMNRQLGRDAEAVKYTERSTRQPGATRR
jgi:tetratricopeptide (TPR) repeat protein